MPSADPSDAQLARLVVRGLAAFISLTLAGGIASAAERLAQPAARARSADGGLFGVGELSPRGGVGALPATAVSTYLRARRAALAAAPPAASRVAVVSFVEYQERSAALETMAGVDVTNFLVALPAGRPLVVGLADDFAALARRSREEAVAERRALEELLPTVEDVDFKRQYQADLERLGELLARSPEMNGPVVYAVVAVGPVARFRAIASSSSKVRLVDVGPTADVPTITGLAGLRPEETTTTGNPPTRP